MYHFEHDILAETLRSSLVSAISALDRFLHDLITENLLKTLARREPPRCLTEFPICVGDTEKVLCRALAARRPGGRRTRPRTVLKAVFREALNRQTFQGSRQVEQALRMLGLKKPWTKISEKLRETPEGARSRLDEIVRRRNQIVHEGDVQHRSRPRSVKLNDIHTTEVRRRIAWLYMLGHAIEALVRLGAQPNATFAG